MLWQYTHTPPLRATCIPASAIGIITNTYMKNCAENKELATMGITKWDKIIVTCISMRSLDIKRAFSLSERPYLSCPALPSLPAQCSEGLHLDSSAVEPFLIRSAILWHDLFTRFHIYSLYMCHWKRDSKYMQTQESEMSTCMYNVIMTYL